MLYGDSSSNAGPSKEEMNRSFAAPGPSVGEGGPGKAEPSHWCLVTRESGVLEVWAATQPSESWFSRLCQLPGLFVQIYQLPDWRLVFLVKNFPVGQRVLVDSSSGQSATQGDKEGKKEEMTRQGEIPLVKEVTLVSLGYNHSRPYLLVSSIPAGPKAGFGLSSQSPTSFFFLLRSTLNRSFSSTRRFLTISSSRRTT